MPHRSPRPNAPVRDRGPGRRWLPAASAAVAVWGTAVRLAAQPPGPIGTAPAAGDSAAVAAVVRRFHAALAAGDSAGALALLAPDLTVLESGEVERRAAYRAHHLPADIGFARAVPTDRRVIQVTVRGDVAWTVATTSTVGTYRGRPVNAAGAELMVLSREAAGWQIRTVHWSSRTRRAGR